MSRSPAVDLDAVRKVSNAINATHRFIYLIPEGAEEAAALGLDSGGPTGPAYFAFRSAALGAVPWQVVLATFYSFAPRAVEPMTGVWDVASPQRWQAARFVVAERAMRRVGVPLTDEQIAEARSLIDPVVAGADYAGRPLGAANASVALPDNPLVALWQQITVLREWRGDGHLLVLADNDLGPCDCNVMQSATNRFPLRLMRATRRWSDEEWNAATERLAERGWIDAEGAVTEAGTAARERIEVETDQRCAALWSPIGADGARRLAALIKPINDAFAAAGTYDIFRAK